MKKLGSWEDNDLRALNRSPYRNMPENCKYCGYRNRPSSSQDMCSAWCLKNKAAKDTGF